MIRDRVRISWLFLPVVSTPAELRYFRRCPAKRSASMSIMCCSQLHSVLGWGVILLHSVAQGPSAQSKPHPKVGRGSVLASLKTGFPEEASGKCSPLVSTRPLGMAISSRFGSRPPSSVWLSPQFMPKLVSLSPPSCALEGGVPMGLVQVFRCRLQFLHPPTCSSRRHPDR